MSADDMTQFIDLFVQESADRFEELNQLLVKLEENPSDEETLYSILRNVHSLKGSSGMFGFENLKRIAHELEDLMELVHRQPDVVDREIMDVLFEGCDILENRFQRVTASSKSENLLPRERTFLEHLEKLLHTVSAGGATLETASRDLLELLRSHLVEVGDLIDVKQLRKSFDRLEHCLSESSSEEESVNASEMYLLAGTNISTFIITINTILKLASSRTLNTGEVKSFFEAFDAFLEAAEAIEDEAVQNAISESRESMEVFEQLALDFDALQYEYYTDIMHVINPFITIKEPEEAEDEDEEDEPLIEVEETKAAGSEAADSPTIARKTVRIEESKIDTFLDSVGEMIILGEVFNHLQKRMAQVVTTDHLGLLREFKGANSEFSKHVFSLQESLMNVRRVEIRNITGSLARLVRDTSRSLSKEIELLIEGDDAVVDKSLLDDINTCLVHIVRNACDHGIEIPETRVSAGKPAGGTITVKAVNEEGALLLKICDDGAGINPERLRARAIEKGLYPESEISHMNEQEVLQLIFQDGFSTAAEVSDISGRGVGMSVVIENIRRMGGNVDVDSRIGKGSTVTLRIPLSIMLSVVDGLIVTVGQNGFVIPIRHVIESFHPGPGQIQPVQGRGECINLRNKIFALHRLSDRFGIKSNLTPKDTGVGILLQKEREEVCILVDSIIDHQQVVIKEVEGLGVLDGILGGSLLGDGTIGLVLDVEALTVSETSVR